MTILEEQRGEQMKERTDEGRNEQMNRRLTFNKRRLFIKRSVGDALSSIVSVCVIMHKKG